MEYFIAVVLFAISSSVTPGPNNIMVMTSGVNFGVRKSVPLLVGICIGFAIMLALVGVGFGQLFNAFPMLHLIIKTAGIGYLLYLSWLIARSAGVMESNDNAKPLSFLKGVLFQWINGKAWVVATGAIAAFTSAGVDYYYQTATVALTFFVVSFPCVGVWLLFGSGLKQVLAEPKHRKCFNYVMAALLALSVLPVAAELPSEWLGYSAA